MTGKRDANAPPLRLLSSMATRALMQALVEQYARETGIAARADADGGLKVAARVRSGESADVVVLAATAIEELIGEGLMLQGSKLDLVRSGVAIAVPGGKPSPDVSREDSLKRAVLGAGSIGYSTGPSGRYLEQLFARWGILDSIRSRIRVAPAGTPVASLVASGQVELGFQQLSELLGIPDITIVGPLPDSIQTFTVFAGAVSARSMRQPAAAALLEYLRSPSHAAEVVRFGMAPLR